MAAASVPKCNHPEIVVDLNCVVGIGVHGQRATQLVELDTMRFSELGKALAQGHHC
jgi:hypothetical protein